MQGASEFVVDVGGEGRHPGAWNLNPSSIQTLGPDKGAPIVRRIPGRADRMPLFDASVDRLIVERTPLTLAALYEIARVIGPHGTIILRHMVSPLRDPHAPARQILPGRLIQGTHRLGNKLLQESVFGPG